MTAPDDTPAALLDRARALYQAGNLGEAGTLAGQAYQADPDNADALFVLGMIAMRSERWDLGARLMDNAIRVQPGNFLYHFHLAEALVRLRRLADAETHYLTSSRFKPDFGPAQVNLGNLRFSQGRHVEAVGCYEQAVRLDPDNVTALYNLGIIAQKYGEHEQALAFLDRALAVDGQAANIHTAKAFSLLMTERFAEGWSEYRWRWKLPNMSPRICPVPPWRGEPPDNLRLYLYTEQGFGDALMFCRYLPLLRKQGATVLLECKPELLKLLTDSQLADRVTARQPGDETPPPFDYDRHLPLLDLPGLFGTTLATIPGPVPYLRTDPALVEKWARRLGAHDRLRVGLSWSGNPEAAANPGRACAFADLRPLLAVPGVAFYSLQKGPPARELTDLADRPDIENLDPELTDFAESAALLENLDILISTDTAVVHLAGALAVETWTLLHTASEWRWLRHRHDSPWYPGMRLFRQERPGHWPQPVQRLAEALAARAKHFRPPRKRETT